MANNDKNLEKIKELRADGNTVWSISRLNSMNNCEYEYFLTYNKRQKGTSNCYSVTGSWIHDKIEGFYEGNNSLKDTFSLDFDVHMAENELLGLDFPSELIRDNFTRDVKHFTEHFKKLNGKFLLEKLMVFQFGEHWIQGYIDAIQGVENDDGNKEINVIDWKVSSKFSGKAKLQHAGRQLLLYKIGLEATSKVKINEVMWCMIKYLNVCHVQKNGNIKRKMCNRGKWVKEMKSALEKEMIKEGLDELEVDILMEEALVNNNIDNLPEFIREKYWLEDCFVKYEVDEEKITELKEYVNSTIELIQSKDPNDESQWKPLDLEKDSFYCNNLCNHRKTCSFRKEYVEGLGVKKKDVLLDFDLF